MPIIAQTGHFHTKKDVIRAAVTVVKIFSLEGSFLAEWPRARYKGEWCTNPEHLPKNYTDFSEGSGTYFIWKASTVGSYTTEVVNSVTKGVAFHADGE